MKKLVALLFCVTVLSSVSNMNVSASNNSNYEMEALSQSEEISTYSKDVIVYKYRYNNGLVQYRRWNETKGVWVDSKWINIG